MMIKLED